MEIYICIDNSYLMEGLKKGKRYFLTSKIISEGFNDLYFICELDSENKKIFPFNLEDLNRYFISLRELRKQKLNKLGYEK